MSKKVAKKVVKKRPKNRRFIKFLPYLVATIAILGVAFYGSIDKSLDQSDSLSMQSIAKDNFKVTADELTEFYVVANLAASMDLANTDALSSNFVAMSVMSAVGQSSAAKIEKPSIIDTSHLPRGVITYVVAAGDTMESIAARYGLTTDQVRWSNGLANTTINVGDTLILPNVPGIVYTVKAGDTVEGIVATYGSTAEQIIAMNDLETSSLSEGARIVLPDGFLPYTERPEYVAPRPSYSTPTTYAYTYTYSGSSWGRQNLRLVDNWYGRYLDNGYTAGQCTWYAKAMRPDLPRLLGNAYSWASNASAAGYRVDYTPSVGAVFQTSAGWYGHVGYVVGVNADGSITVREMNYSYQPFLVYESEIPASQVGNFLYIH